MKQCDKCRCDGRRRSVETREDGEYAVYVCANPRCGNYRQVFAEEKLEPPQDGKDEF